MDGSKWMDVLVKWIKQTEFINIQEETLERTDIKEFFNQFKIKLLPDIEVIGDVCDFIKTYFEDFEIHMDDDNQISSLDYMYLYSLFLYFCCVKYPNAFFHKACNSLEDAIQTAIAKFFNLLCEEEKIDKNAVRKAIHIAVPNLPTVQVYCVDSPIKTPRVLKYSPSTPKTAVLDGKTRELQLIKAQLETERYDKSYLEMQLKQSEDRITKFLKEQKQYVGEIHDLKLRLTNRDEENLSPNAIVKNDFITNRLKKNVLDKDEEIYNLKLQIENLEADYKNSLEKITHSQDYVVKMTDKLKELDATIEEMKIQIHNKDEQLRCSEEINKDLQSFINETRSNLTTRDILNMSAECLDFSFSQQTTNTSAGSDIVKSPENLARSVIDLQLREKENEIKVLQESLYIMKKENEALLQNLNEFLISFAPISISSNNNVDTLLDGFTKLNEINTNIVNEHESLKQQYDSVAQNIEVIKEEKNSISLDLQKCEESKQLLSDKFEILNEKYTKLNTSLLEEQQQTLKYESVITNLQSTLESQIEEKNVCMKNLEDLETEKQAVETKLLAIVDNFNAKSSECVDIQSKYDVNRECLAKLELMLNDVNYLEVPENINELSQQDAQLPRGGDILENFSRLVSKLNEQTLKSNEMVLVNQKIESNLLNYEQTINELKNQNDLSTINLTAVLEKNSALEKCITDLKLKYSELEKTTTDKDSNLAKCTKDLEESITLNSDLQKENNDIKENHESLKKSNEILQERLDNLELQFNQINEQNTNLQETITKTELEQNEVTSKYDKLSSDFENIAFSLKTFTDQNTILSKLNDELENQLKDHIVNNEKLIATRHEIEGKLQSAIEEKDKLNEELQHSSTLMENVKKEILINNQKFEEMCAQLKNTEVLYQNECMKNQNIHMEYEMLEAKNIELSTTLKKSTTDYENIQSDLDKLSSNLESISSENVSLKREIDQLSENLEILQKKYDLSLESNKMATAEVEALKLQTNEVQQQLENTMQENDSLKLEHEKESNALKEEIVQKNEETVNLEKTVNEFISKIEKLESECTELSSKWENLTVEKTNLTKERDDLMINLNNMKSEFNILDAQTKILECNLLEYKNNLVETVEEHSNLKTDYEQIKSQMEATTNEKKTTLEMYEALQNELRVTKEEMNTKILDIQNNCTAKEDASRKLNEEITNLTADHLKNLTLLSDKSEDLENKNENLKIQCRELENEVSTLQAKLTTLNESFANSCGENKELKNLNNELILKTTDLEKTLAQLTEELKCAKQNNQDLSALNDEINAKILDLSNQVEEYKRFKENHNNCDQRISEITSNVQILDDQKNDLTQKLTEAQTQHDYLKSEYESLVVREELSKTEYEEKLKAFDIKYSSLIQNMDAKEQQIDEVKKEMRTIKEASDSLKMEKIKVIEEKLAIENALMEMKLENSVISDKIDRMETLAKEADVKYMNLSKEHNQALMEMESIQSNLKCHSENSNSMGEIIQIFTESFNKLGKEVQCDKLILSPSADCESNKLKKQLDDLSKTIIKLKEAGEVAIQANAELKVKLEESSNEKLKLEQSNTEIIEKFNQSETLLNRITTELQEFEKDNSKMNENYIEMQTNFAVINDKYKILENQFDEMKSLCEMKTKSCDALTEENSKLIQTQSEIEINLSDKTEALLQNKKLLENSQEEVKILQNHISTLDIELKAKCENVKMQKQSSFELQSSVSLQKTKIEFLEKQLSQKEKTNAEENQRIAELLHQIEKYKAYEIKINELDKLQGKATGLNDKLNQDNAILQAKLLKHRKMSEEKDNDQKTEIMKLQKVIEENKLSEYNKIKEQRLEYEGKLEKMKEKMKSLFIEETNKIKQKHEKESFEKEKTISDYVTQNEKLSKQIYALNDKNLTLMKENELIVMKLKIRDSSVCDASNMKRSTIASSSQGLSTNFRMEDEEGEIFNNTYLTDLKNGRQSTDFSDAFKCQELQYRNSMVPPHLRSAYAVQFNGHDIGEDDIKDGYTTNLDDSSMGLLTNGQRKKIGGTTSYKKPGPPTPSKNGGRLSIGGSSDPQYREILKESNKKGTPGKLKSLFSGTGTKSTNNIQNTKDENSTPKRRLSIFRARR